MSLTKKLENIFMLARPCAYFKGTFCQKTASRSRLFHSLYTGTIAFTLFLASPAYSFTIEEAVRAALQTNPQIGEAIENLRANEEQIKITEARFLPTLSLSSTVGYQFHDEGSGADPRRAGNNLNTSLTLSQTIYDGGSTTSEVERNQAQALSSRHNVNQTAESTALSAIQVYLQTLQERELTALAEDNVRRHQETLALVERKVAGGGATLSDVQTALFRLASAQNLLALAQSRLRDARATYKLTVGSLPATMIRPSVPRELLPRNLQGAIGASIQNSPQVASARSDIDVARKAVEISEAATLPTITFSLVTSANQDQSTDNTGVEKDATATVRLEYGLYDGGNNHHTKQQRTFQLGASRQAYNLAVRQIEETLRRAWAALIAARESVISNQKENQAYEQVRDIFQKQFETGTRTLLDVLQSEAQLYQSQVNLITAIYNEMFSSYRLLGATGQLMPALNIITPDQPSFYAQGSPVTEARQRRIFASAPSNPGSPGAIPYYRPNASSYGAVNPYQGYPVYAPEQENINANIGSPQSINNPIRNRVTTEPSNTIEPQRVIPQPAAPQVQSSPESLDALDSLDFDVDQGNDAGQGSLEGNAPVDIDDLDLNFDDLDSLSNRGVRYRGDAYTTNNNGFNGLAAQPNDIQQLGSVQPLNIDQVTRQPRRLPLAPVRNNNVSAQSNDTRNQIRNTNVGLQTPLYPSPQNTSANVIGEIIPAQPFFPTADISQRLDSSPISQIGVARGLAAQPSFGIDAAAIARDSNQRQAEAYARSLQAQQSQNAQASNLRILPPAPNNNQISAPPPSIFTNNNSQ